MKLDQKGENVHYLGIIKKYSYRAHNIHTFAASDVCDQSLNLCICVKQFESGTVCESMQGACALRSD